MEELEKARTAKMGTRILCTVIIALTADMLWGHTAAWLALAVATLFSVCTTGIEQEVRRFADALIRAEKRVVENAPHR